MNTVSSLFSKLGAMSWKRIFFIGLFLRVLLMPITGHWDLTSLNSVANHFFTTGPFSFYFTDIAIYPPLTYLTLAFWQALIRPFLFPDFVPWLNTPIVTEFFSPHTLRYFFLMKLLFLPFDLGIAYLLSKFGRSEKESKILASLWLFNPIVLYIVFSWGTIDVIATFLALLAIYLVTTKKWIFGFVFFGLGALYKIWPLLLLPYVVLLVQGDWKKRTYAFLLGIAPFFLVIAPYLRIPNFVTFVLASDRLSLIGNAGLYIGFLEWLLIYLFLYVFGLFWVNKHESGVSEKVIDISLLVLVFFYITSAFTPQWFLWILPFFLIQIVRFPNLIKPFIFVIIGYLLVILTFDITLSLGLFAPIEPTLWQTPFVKEYIERIMKDPTRIWSIFRTINSAFLSWFVYEWYLARRKNEKNSN